MANACSSQISYGARTMPLAILCGLFCIARTAAVRSPYGHRTFTVRPPYGCRTMLRLLYPNRTVTVQRPYGDRTATVRRLYGDRTMPSDISCKDNPAATVRSPYDVLKNYSTALKPPEASYDV